MRFSYTILVKHIIQLLRFNNSWCIEVVSFSYMYVVKWKQEVLEGGVEDRVFYYQYKIGIQLMHQYYQDLQLQQHIILFTPIVAQ
jgi:hypothetical protein